MEIYTKCKYPNNIIVVLDERKAYNLPVEYNWRPPRCKHCDVFRHTVDGCVKKSKQTNTVAMWLRKECESATSDSANIMEKERSGDIGSGMQIGQTSEGFMANIEEQG